MGGTRLTEGRSLGCTDHPHAKWRRESLQVYRLVRACALACVRACKCVRARACLQERARKTAETLACNAAGSLLTAPRSPSCRARTGDASSCAGLLGDCKLRPLCCLPGIPQEFFWAHLKTGVRVHPHQHLASLAVLSAGAHRPCDFSQDPRTHHDPSPTTTQGPPKAPRHRHPPHSPEGPPVSAQIRSKDHGPKGSLQVLFLRISFLQATQSLSLPLQAAGLLCNKSIILGAPCEEGQ